ncbi:MAG: DNA integrity scanning diadenylate cyclase DisA [Dermatophilaceae bacterium]
MERSDDDLLRATLAAIAPGTELREGLERILRGRTGALIVLGRDRTVERISTGGFPLDIEFSAARLRELAKMDGAIILDRDAGRIVRAATHLVPDASIESNEYGTRHRTSERVAKQTSLPVISVSQSMHTIALYVGDLRHVMEASTVILSKANQALATLERYRARLDEVTATLSALEVDDVVTVRDVALVVQRHEMVRRISEEVSAYVLELGTDGRLVALQSEELTRGVRRERALVVADYLQDDGWRTLDGTLASLEASSVTDMLDLSAVAATLGYPASAEALDDATSPWGHRLLARIPRLPRAVADRLIEHFEGLQPLLCAGLEELMAVDGVGETRARTIREGLSRIAESSLIERYT